MTKKTQPTPQVAVATPAGPQTAMEILTPEQLAGRLQIKPKTVYELTRSRCSNPMPAIKVGKVLRFSWGDVLVWLQQRRKAS